MCSNIGHGWNFTKAEIFHVTDPVKDYSPSPVHKKAAATSNEIKLRARSGDMRAIAYVEKALRVSIAAPTIEMYIAP